MINLQPTKAIELFAVLSKCGLYGLMKLAVSSGAVRSVLL